MRLRNVYNSFERRFTKLSLANDVQMLSSTKHKIIDSNKLSDRRVFVMGDIHGCADEMIQLLEESGSLDSDTIILSVGDIVNKGPKNIDVIKYLRKIGAYAVRGNHDEWVLQQYFHLKKKSDFSLDKKSEWIKDLSVNDVNYLSHMPYTISLPSISSIVVHAGLVHGVELKDQKPKDMITMRNITDEGIATSKSNIGKPWAEVWAGSHNVYFGHDALRGYQMHPYAIGLDTGCVYGGALTGIYITYPYTIHHVKPKKIYAGKTEWQTHLRKVGPPPNESHQILPQLDL